MRRVLPLFALLLASCIDTGVGLVERPLAVEVVSGTTFDGRDGFDITLDVAELAFGPFYLCPAPQAGDLCDLARAESLDTVIIDATESGTREIGVLQGTSGTVRSAMWSYGRTWPLTASTPEGPTSLRLVGSASRDDLSVPFDWSIDLDPVLAGQVLIRAASSIDADLGAPGTLVVTVDASTWMDGIDWNAVSEGDDSQALRSLRTALTTRAVLPIRYAPAP